MATSTTIHCFTREDDSQNLEVRHSHGCVGISSGLFYGLPCLLSHRHLYRQLDVSGPRIDGVGNLRHQQAEGVSLT
jgi:hypothetical protein